MPPREGDDCGGEHGGKMESPFLNVATQTTVEDGKRPQDNE